MKTVSRYICLAILSIFALLVLSLYIYIFCTNILTIIIICGLGVIFEMIMEIMEIIINKIKKGIRYAEGRFSSSRSN